MTLVQRKIVTLALAGAGLQVCGVGLPFQHSVTDDVIRTPITDSNSQTFKIADSIPATLKSVFKTSSPNSDGICLPNSGNKHLAVFNENATASSLIGQDIPLRGLIAPPNYFSPNTGFQEITLTCGNS